MSLKHRHSPGFAGLLSGVGGVGVEGCTVLGFRVFGFRV